MPFATVIGGLDRACRDAFDQLGLRAQLIMCFLRDLTADSALETLAQSLPYADKIVGVGLDSDERGNPPLKFGGVFERARGEGYRLTMHCDVDQEESVGHIWQCLDEIGVERIDHGVTRWKMAHWSAAGRRPDRADGLPGLERLGDRENEGPATEGDARPELRATVNSDDPAYFEAM